SEGKWACIRITNTGQLSEAERLQLLEGEASGRGLYITTRIVRLLGGKMDIEVGKHTTSVVVKIPAYLY
ncbi:MAG: HAMP domain-containing histidine kinase, partial [Deltaproteobacteria bacterium]|nr:HAMP domain-containing histidine kinase [Deltaproteobacteria bacterium]